MKPFPSLLPILKEASVTTRMVLTSVFWGNALMVLAGPYSSLDDVHSYGTDALRFYLLMSMALQLFGSALIITRYGVWIGAAALAAQIVVALAVERSWSGVYAAGALRQAHLALVQIVALGCIVGLALIHQSRLETAVDPSEDPATPSDGGYKSANWRYI